MTPNFKWFLALIAAGILSLAVTKAPKAQEMQTSQYFGEVTYQCDKYRFEEHLYWKAIVTEPSGRGMMLKYLASKKGAVARIYYQKVFLTENPTQQFDLAYIVVPTSDPTIVTITQVISKPNSSEVDTVNGQTCRVVGEEV